MEKQCIFCDLLEHDIQKSQIPCMRNPSGTYHEFNYQGSSLDKYLQEEKDGLENLYLMNSQDVRHDTMVVPHRLVKILIQEAHSRAIAEFQRDVQSVIFMLEGKIDNFKIIDFIRKYMIVLPDISDSE